MTDETKQTEAQADATPIEPQGEAADVAGTEPALTDGAATTEPAAAEVEAESAEPVAEVAETAEPEPVAASAEASEAARRRRRCTRCRDRRRGSDRYRSC